MRILITGVCGFVGSTLALGFLQGWPGWQIVGIDNLIRPGSETNRRRLKQQGVQVIHGDIRNPSDLELLPECDWIVDAAANPSVLAGVDGRTSSRQLLEHNLTGTINLLELGKGWRAGFIMLSTSRVYSIPPLARLKVHAAGSRFVPVDDALPPGLGSGGVAEAFSTEPPLSLYGTSKRASELLALEYGATYQMPVCINRCGVLAGAGQFGKVDQGIFSFWIHSYLARRPLKYIGFDGTGFQVRDCLHARDLIPLLATQVQRGNSSAPAVLNVSGGLAQSASLRQLSDWCAARFGAHEVGADTTARQFDVPWLVLDSAMARTHYRWQPQITLEEIWSEIAVHAEQNPGWLEQCND
jgi:CDP-paratose 2-epimerase